jgi:Phosphodiester glycosidase
MYKLKPVVLTTLLILLVALSFSAGCSNSSGYAASVEYEHRITDDPNSIHITRFVPGKGRIVLAKARKFSLGRETVSSIGNRANALMAVNASFFVMDDKFAGIPAGMLKIKNEWHGVPRLPRAVIGWTEDGSSFLMDQLEMNWTATIGEQETHIHMLNTVRNRNYLLLYTKAFNSTTMAAPGGLEIIVRNNRIAAFHADGNAEIPENGYVLSYGVEAAKEVGPFEIGLPVEISHDFRPVHPEHASDEQWKRMDYLVGGAGLLIFDGEPVRDYMIEKLSEGFDTTRHPRTAVGINEQGIWIFAVIDGRQPGRSVGMSLDELTDLMLSLGCVSAINLDGGGSTTMFVNGSVVNTPSDVSGERPVADALMVLE